MTSVPESGLVLPFNELSARWNLRHESLDRLIRESPLRYEDTRFDEIDGNTGTYQQFVEEAREWAQRRGQDLLPDDDVYTVNLRTHVLFRIQDVEVFERDHSDTLARFRPPVPQKVKQTKRHTKRDVRDQCREIANRFVAGCEKSGRLPRYKDAYNDPEMIKAYKDDKPELRAFISWMKEVPKVLFNTKGGRPKSAT